MAGKHTLRGIVDIVTNLVVRVDDLDALPPGSGDVSTDSIFSAKGDLPAGTGVAAAIRLGVGTNGQVLSADSSEASGLKWITPAVGGDLLAANNLSDVANAATARTNLGIVSLLGNSYLFGDGIATSFVIPHVLGTSNLIPVIYKVSTGEKVNADIVIDGTNATITFTGLPVPTLDEFKLVLIGF